VKRSRASRIPETAMSGSRRRSEEICWAGRSETGAAAEPMVAGGWISDRRACEGRPVERRTKGGEVGDGEVHTCTLAGKWIHSCLYSGLGNSVLQYIEYRGLRMYYEYYYNG
jgi:hypothetical protein